MSTIQELGAFLAREQAAGITPTPASTAPAKAATTPASSPSPTVELPASEAGFNTDYNGAPAARPR
jgi:hypothetical protein